MYAMTTGSTICGHRSPLAPELPACQLPPGHGRAGRHRDSSGNDVQHVWQVHEPADQAAGLDGSVFWNGSATTGWS
jgi:hypothetical protein